MVHTLKFAEKSKEGKIYWVVDDYTLKFSLKGVSFDYKNLFNGNKLLEENILKVLNENWKEVSEVLIEGLEKAYSTVLKSVANQLFAKVPVDEIFPK